MKKRDVTLIAGALVDICKDLPDTWLPEAIDAALRLLEKRGFGRAIKTFPRTVADVLRKKEGMIVASLTTPSAAGNHRSSLEFSLGKALKRKISLEGRKDPSILGGALLSYGDERFDVSLRGALDQMQSHLTSSSAA